MKVDVDSFFFPLSKMIPSCEYFPLISIYIIQALIELFLIDYLLYFMTLTAKTCQ